MGDGDRSFPGLPSSPPGERLSICLASPDVSGAIRSGATDPPCLALAEFLADEGHEVTVLYARGDHGGQPPAGDWAAAYSRPGLSLVPCPRPARVEAPEVAQTAFAVHEWLRRRAFDIVYFPDWRGCGYFALQAKRAGVAFRETALVVIAQSPTLWKLEADRQPLTDRYLLLHDDMERCCVELADAVVSPSRRMLCWMQARGWRPPPSTFVQPDLARAMQATATPSSAADDEAANRAAWRGFQAWAAQLGRDVAPRVIAYEGPSPAVTVCLVHHNRPDALKSALDGIERQTFTDFEVILVDDGSAPEAVEELRSSIEPRLAARGWRLILQENLYLGAARNRAAREARGRYLLFHDDDNIARPIEIERLVGIAETAAADIVTTAMGVFAGAEPAPEDEPEAVWLPLGPVLSFGAIDNLFGDANALVRRDVFERLGGFTEDHGLGNEDWEFFAKAALSGCRFAVSSEPLFHYRLSPQGMLQTGHVGANLQRSLRPYLTACPPPQRNLLALAQGLATSMAQTEQARAGRERDREARPPPLASIAQALFQSRTMRCTRPARNLVNRLTRQPLEPASLPVMSEEETTAFVLRVMNSTSWSMLGPLRVILKLLRAGRVKTWSSPPATERRRPPRPGATPSGRKPSTHPARSRRGDRRPDAPPSSDG